MDTMIFIKRLWRDDQAATAVEYAVMLGLILIVAISAIATVGQQNGGLWGGIDGDLVGAGFGG